MESNEWMKSSVNTFGEINYCKGVYTLVKRDYQLPDDNQNWRNFSLLKNNIEIKRLHTVRPIPLVIAQNWADEKISELEKLEVNKTKYNKEENIMKEVANDIIYVEINDGDTIASLKEKFINIMKKHNIKYGMIDKSGNVHVANFEWTMCQVLFLDTIIVKLKMDMMLMDLPKDLEY